MPVGYRMKPQLIFGGCDICEARDRQAGGFVLQYTFGFGSPIDGDSVEAAVCDKCLENLIREHIPNAQWTSHN